MNIGELRQELKTWLSGKLRIDCWGLGLPDSINSSDKPPSIGLDKPALDITFLESQGFGKQRIVTTETVIPFQVIYRFDASWKYDDLPRSDAETILTQILFELQTPSCINFDISQLEPSGSVSIAEHKNGDKLLIFEIDIKAQFPLENTVINTKIFAP
ncbi:hypothetical protein ACX27_04220 [Nostoc piscinale CENA21]|uniref:Uncharacterized protein n=1 Tax=Nostoc piscinale CENA21 TaxID=224013 RepID=A0A0M4TIA1_9NOSO|nr:hypothetical protein [Nostoc piscinale]ALF52236.1 hypothetical protein ACX27_04220 [Nostoc piscinale CENA21]